MDNHNYLMTYVHYDGYPEHTGKILETMHDSYERANALLYGNHIRSLSEDGKVQYFEDGEAEEFETIEDAMNGVDYCYVYIEKWHCYSFSGTKLVKCEDMQFSMRKKYYA